ncbi:MAG: alpha-galactosidase [Clostridiales bacterium]|nr:alpha-galactosidase [Clostridiales bacterium]
MFKLKSIFCLIQAFLLIVSHFSLYDSNFKRWMDRGAMAVTSVTDFSFETLTAEDTAVTESEKAKCRVWYKENILTAGNPAYGFKVNGKSLRKSIENWDITVGEESREGEYRRFGKTAFITLKSKKSPLTATVEATIYEKYATCEWTVFIENTGESNSPDVSEFYAADFTLDTGISDIYFSKGSEPDSSDFELMKSAVCPTPMVFNANGGRSESWLPFFNISGKHGGAVITNGWTGQWYSAFRQGLGGVAVKEKQEFFKGCLTPGEKVRSPLVSITFYENSNPLKGFNSFRRWMTDCVYTESANCLTCTLLGGEFDLSTDKQFIEKINSYDEETCQRTDYLWKDAGWYQYSESWWDGVGNWTPDPARFPDGFAGVAEAAEKRGMKFLLWYEPERCCKGTEVYNECKKHDGWLIEKSDEVNMVNLAFDGACDYLGSLIANSIKDNKVGLYRQDFNFQPLAMWQKADKTLWGNREGFEENHYVTNLYRYLDTLLEVNPGLVIDNCASGGKRLDLEMSRRSIPLWRTDYNCSDAQGVIKPDALESTQSQTYGLSFWLPLSGSGLNAFGEYAHRSLITACTQRVGYEEVRQYMDKYYYPLTWGARDTEKYHAMQFGDGEEGFALIFKRENVKENTYRLVLSGLSPEKIYTLTDFDSFNPAVTKSGKVLMQSGVEIKIEETPKAAIIVYKEAY